MTIESLGQPLRLASGETVPLSAAMRAGDFIFVSGQLGIDAQGRLVAPDVTGQVRQCIERIRAILAEAGVGLDAVIKASVWLTEPSDFAAFNAAYRELFPERPPARSTVVSALLIPGARVEIEVVAYIERPRSRHSTHSRSEH